MKRKRGETNVVTGKIFWAYLKGKEYWVEPQQFELMLKKLKDNYLANKKERVEYTRDWQLQNPSKVRQAHEKWVKANPRYQGQYKKNRRSVDPYFRLQDNLRGRIRYALSGKRKSISTQRLLGASFEVVRNHIEQQFKDGMTWENYNYDTWHIHHIIPCEQFDLTDPEQQRKCFHYMNLQPLWAKEHIELHKKI